MALKKTILGINGVQTEYHKICAVQLNAKDNDDKFPIIVSVNSYTAQEYRDASEAFVAVLNNYVFKVDTEEIEAKAMFALAYEKLKELELFEGAEDC